MKDRVGLLRPSHLFTHRRCPKLAWLSRWRPELAAERPRVIPQWDLLAVAQAEPGAKPAEFRRWFRHAGLEARIDRLAAGVVTEYRATVRPKPQHIKELAVKAWIVAQSGETLHTVRLAYINADFVYPGNGDYRGFFVEQDVTDEVRAWWPAVPDWLQAAESELQAHEPEASTGSHCRKPGPCVFLDYCQAPPPTDYPVTDLRATPALVRALQEDGYEDLREVPARRLQKPLHRRIHRAAVSGEPQLDAALVEFARALPYPRYYLDFEAVQFAVPMWPQTRPFESLPFQWACRIERAPAPRRSRSIF
ncbi:hypothetical protein CAI21_15870 [Alkalilimnicola ehrlichii]|uniref:DUF2779 domain-containing protein n=1 Tax=Alkalilimnicola ehrlichii TaxID=351052 RepID=A0A3E0WQ78_9GAMM|nr:DUF2779 domain-containing protein [Alkalilimnicola ehrlichii]RFA27024.1 hypothetical protein CAI21_15870 [Alkalilimnicola ehrlichii]RFA34146.1 hypothetical protein CAL65_16000 [Alkalilimnicola ehrlichii]